MMLLLQSSCDDYFPFRNDRPVGPVGPQKRFNMRLVPGPMGAGLGELLARWAGKDRFRVSASCESITDNLPEFLPDACTLRCDYALTEIVVTLRSQSSEFGRFRFDVPTSSAAKPPNVRGNGPDETQSRD